jgi:hypothetical protein
VTAREQHPKRGLLDPVVRNQCVWPVGDVHNKGAQETNLSSPREMSMSKGTWETNVPERETAAIRRDRELLTSAVQERWQVEAASKQHQAANRGAASSTCEGRDRACDITGDRSQNRITQTSRHGRTPAQSSRNQQGRNPAHGSETPGKADGKTPP